MLIYSIDSRNSFEEAQAMYTWITNIRDKEMPVVSPCIRCLMEAMFHLQY